MARPRTFIFDKDTMHDLYVNRAMPPRAIARQLGCTEALVQRRLKELGFVLVGRRDLLDIERVTLERLYTVQRRTVAQISKELGCSISAVRDHLVKHGLLEARELCDIDAATLRDLYWAQGMSMGQIGTRYGWSSGAIMLRMKKLRIKTRERANGLQITDDEVSRMYLEEKLTMGQIAERCGGSKSGINNRVRKLGLAISEGENRERNLARNKNKYSYRYESTYIHMKRQDHPSANPEGYVTEHRLVVEEAIGRYLTTDENVHHINMRKHDNRIENLALVSSSRDHHRLHKYIERVGVFLAGLSGATAPKPLVFDGPSFWAGQWVTEIDLIKRSRPSFADSFKAAIDAIPTKERAFIQ